MALVQFKQLDNSSSDSEEEDLALKKKPKRP